LHSRSCSRWPDQARHGYDIIREVDVRTDGIIRLRSGSLYTLLQRFCRRGIDRSSLTTDPIRMKTTSAGVYYRVTELGRKVLAAEARRLESAVAEARRKQVFRTFEGLTMGAVPERLEKSLRALLTWCAGRVSPDLQHETSRSRHGTPVRTPARAADPSPSRVRRSPKFSTC
jgi:DNA-binding PadR family transcriptional regulator